MNTDRKESTGQSCDWHRPNRGRVANRREIREANHAAEEHGNVGALELDLDALGAGRNAGNARRRGIDIGDLALRDTVVDDVVACAILSIGSAPGAGRRGGMVGAEVVSTG